MTDTTSATPELDIIEGREDPVAGDPIAIELDAPPEPKKGKVAADPDPKPQEGKVDDGVESLKRQLAEERRVRLAAESRQREAEKRATESEGRVSTHEANVIDGAIRLAEQERLAARRAFIDARSAGDAEKEADAQQQMAEVAVKLDRLNAGKAELARRAEMRPTEGAVVEQHQTRPDPVEATAANLPPKSAAWVRSHPEVIQDPLLNAEMVLAHHRAIKDGIEPESAEYFAAIEKRLGFGQQEPQQRQEPAARQEQQQVAEPTRRAPVAAPVRAATQTPTNNGRRTITLTPEQRAAAREMDMTDEAYARNLVALQDEGIIQRRTH